MTIELLLFLDMMINQFLYFCSLCVALGEICSGLIPLLSSVK